MPDWVSFRFLRGYPQALLGPEVLGQGLLSTTADNITEDVIMGYLDRHIRKNGFSPSA